MMMTQARQTMKTGFIGLGAMGMPIARNLAKTGCLHNVWNRTKTKAETLAGEFPIHVAENIADLTRQSHVIFLCVSADEDVLAIVNTMLASLQAGTIVIDMSTISPATAIEASTLLTEKQAFFLDAPVSGGVEGAKNGRLVMMVGGDRTALQNLSPLLQAITARVEWMGKSGSGQGCKAVNQIMAAGINQAVTEALAFAKALDLPMGKVIEVLGGGAAGNWFLQHRGPSMVAGSFAPGFKLALHHKDLKICQKIARQNRVISDLLDKTLDDYQQLMQQGYGDEDISALYRKKNRPGT